MSHLKALAPDSISSPIIWLAEFFTWYGLEPLPGLAKATGALTGGSGVPRTLRCDLVGQRPNG